eukprot:GFYU01003426.1.p1 GENE.GFYU01003426.1~~GFYU01003426.1.p1  ORF type:complete len:449 (+),score=101.51 GFYU01003426.1:758-2104(+)
MQITQSTVTKKRGRDPATHEDSQGPSKKTRQSAAATVPASKGAKKKNTSVPRGVTNAQGSATKALTNQVQCDSKDVVQPATDVPPVALLSHLVAILKTLTPSREVVEKTWPECKGTEGQDSTTQLMSLVAEKQTELLERRLCEQVREAHVFKRQYESNVSKKGMIPTTHANRTHILQDPWGEQWVSNVPSFEFSQLSSLEACLRLQLQPATSTVAQLISAAAGDDPKSTNRLSHWIFTYRLVMVLDQMWSNIHTLRRQLASSVTPLLGLETIIIFAANIRPADLSKLQEVQQSRETQEASIDGGDVQVQHTISPPCSHPQDPAPLFHRCDVTTTATLEDVNVTPPMDNIEKERRDMLIEGTEAGWVGEEEETEKQRGTEKEMDETDKWWAVGEEMEEEMEVEMEMEVEVPAASPQDFQFDDDLAFDVAGIYGDANLEDPPRYDITMAT